MEKVNEHIVFVTVGTTKFDKLINEVSSEIFLNTLVKLGYTKVIYQTGNGEHKIMKHPKLEIVQEKYFENFEEQINKASLVISHAGAGTCIEVLQRKKPLIVVINEDLMGNHQIELAEELQTRGYLYWCKIGTLIHTLLTNNLDNLKEYPSIDKNLFSSYLDKCVGFV